MVRAIRDNEVSAEAMGKDVTRRHLQIFIIGSAVVGLAGAMMTSMDGQLTPPPMQPDRVGDVSFWYADIGLPVRRAALDGDATADVCIIGAGYTGLWTAWYLKQANPGLQVVVLEKEFAGFGASGRNGGWLTGGFAWNHARYLARSDEAGVRAMVEAMNGTVDEVIRVAEAQGIDADIRRTDELMVAVNPAQHAADAGRGGASPRLGRRGPGLCHRTGRNP
jgi:hypothetical protein